MSVTREEALADVRVIRDTLPHIGGNKASIGTLATLAQRLDAYLEQPDARDLVARLLVPAKAHLDRLRIPPVHPYAGEALRRLEGLIEEAEGYAAGESRPEARWVSVEERLPKHPSAPVVVVDKRGLLFSTKTRSPGRFVSAAAVAWLDNLPPPPEQGDV